MSLCEYAEDLSSGISVVVKCKLSKDYCGMYRYCTQQHAPVMNDIYKKHGCKVKKEFGVDVMSKKKKSVEKQPIVIEDDTIVLEKICKVNYTKNGETSISYSDNGTSYNMFVDGVYVDSINIKYKSTFCEKNIISIEQL